MTRSSFLGYKCSKCGTAYPAEELQTICKDSNCGRPLLAKYDLLKAKATLNLQALKTREASLWRYEEVLLVDQDDAVTLGEGFTPLLKTRNLGEAAGFNSDMQPTILVKDESANPTGSFKARGLCMAISVMRKLGGDHAALPTAGNAGAAAAAYSARAGIKCHVAMPTDTPKAMIDEVQAYGADLYTVDGLIGDAATVIKKGVAEHGWVDLSTLKEPYRLEGKKTMGYELWEQLDGKLPQHILYPTGGGTGLIGMWKAFQELLEMNLITGPLPKMYAVQSTGCAPIVKAFNDKTERSEAWKDAATIAPGIRIPTPFADDLILSTLRESKGGAIAVTDDEIVAAMKTVSSSEGIDVCPEGAATFAALSHLRKNGAISKNDYVVLFNTGTGLKHPELR